MALFGEIVEPTSRTAWEDWDEIQSSGADNDSTQLKWLNRIETPSSIQTFLIFEGKYLSDIVKAQSDHVFQLTNSISEANLCLFEEEGKKRYVCTVCDYDIVKSSEIVELLRPYIRSSQTVLAIQTKPLPLYQTTAAAEDCVIRAVSTTTSTSFGKEYPKLEQPNIISGVSAGAIFLRELMGLSGTAFVCYMEYPEDYITAPLQQLLGKLNIHSAKAKPSNILNSNLYI